MIVPNTTYAIVSSFRPNYYRTRARSRKKSCKGTKKNTYMQMIGVFLLFLQNNLLAFAILQEGDEREFYAR
jgi:hypothetical protein